MNDESQEKPETVSIEKRKAAEYCGVLDTIGSSGVIVLLFGGLCIDKPKCLVKMFLAGSFFSSVLGVTLHEVGYGRLKSQNNRTSVKCWMVDSFHQKKKDIVEKAYYDLMRTICKSDCSWMLGDFIDASQFCSFESMYLYFLNFRYCYTMTKKHVGMDIDVFQFLKEGAIGISSRPAMLEFVNDLYLRTKPNTNAILSRAAEFAIVPTNDERPKRTCKPPPRYADGAKDEDIISPGDDAELNIVSRNCDGDPEFSGNLERFANQLEMLYYKNGGRKRKRRKTSSTFVPGSTIQEKMDRKEKLKSKKKQQRKSRAKKGSSQTAAAGSDEGKSTKMPPTVEVPLVSPPVKFDMDTMTVDPGKEFCFVLEEPYPSLSNVDTKGQFLSHPEQVAAFHVAPQVRLLLRREQNILEDTYLAKLIF